MKVIERTWHIIKMRRKVAGTIWDTHREHPPGRELHGSASEEQKPSVVLVPWWLSCRIQVVNPSDAGIDRNRFIAAQCSLNDLTKLRSPPPPPTVDGVVNPKYVFPRKLLQNKGNDVPRILRKEVRMKNP